MEKDLAKREAREKIKDIQLKESKEKEAKYREKITSNSKKWNFEISHESTSSSCSFDDHEIEPHNILASDVRYNIRLEKLLPKSLRRRRFQRVDDNTTHSRSEFYENVRSNPEIYKKSKGIRTFLTTIAKKKTENASKKQEKTRKIAIARHPWLLVLTDGEKKLPRDKRDVAIRIKYNEILNSETLDDDITFDPKLIDFIQWYEKRKKNMIVESDVSPSEVEELLYPASSKSATQKPIIQKTLPPPIYDDEVYDEPNNPFKSSSESENSTYGYASSDF